MQESTVSLSVGKVRILPSTFRALITAQKRAQFEGEAIMLLIPEVIRFVLPNGTEYAPTVSDVEQMPFDDVIKLEDELLRTEKHRPAYNENDATLATLASGLKVRMRPVLAKDMMQARRLAQNPLEVSVYMMESCMTFETPEGTFEPRIYEHILDNCSLADGLGLQALLFDRDEKKHRR